ncbi:MAG: FTR1 family protein [Sulfurifustaceae bacterium]
MFATAVIVWREVLEAAMVVGLVMAAARGLRGRGVWIGSGIAGGIAGAGIVAAFAGSIAAAAQGMGQEIFNAAVLFAAVGMLGWHNVWMSRHGAELAVQIKAVGRDVMAGVRPQYLLATVVGLAVLREGSEVVLFLYGIAIAQQDQPSAMWTGAFVGLALGAGMGLLLYLGLLRLAARHLFAVTGWLIALLAAGMAAQGAGFLVQADVLPSLREPLWDTSAWLSQKDLLGHVLQVLVGYIDRPAGMQVLFYAVTLATILILSRLYGSFPARPQKTNAVGATN